MVLLTAQKDPKRPGASSFSAPLTVSAPARTGTPPAHRGQTSVRAVVSATDSLKEMPSARDEKVLEAGIDLEKINNVKSSIFFGLEVHWGQRLAKGRLKFLVSD